MRGLSSLAAATMLFAMPASALPEEPDLADECERVYKVYPALMMAVMLEGDVNCGDPDSGEYVSCNEGESPAEKAARERRLAVRQHQEAGYKIANEACDAWNKDRKDPARIEALKRAIEQARATNRWRPEQAAPTDQPAGATSPAP